jgi:ketosteroid isomerase-like protein
VTGEGTDEQHVRQVVGDFYRAFLGGDVEALTELVASEAVWAVRGETAISGLYRRPAGIAALRRRLDDLTAGTWRPLRDDSFDVAASAWHGVIMDRFLAERGSRQLDSHEVIVAAVEESRVRRLFHYLHDPLAFADFWAA